jgi:predicted ABC-class ATPase
MRNKEYLKRTLSHLDGKGYKAYKEIQGEYDFQDFTVIIDHVQGDPFAAPSRIRVKIPGGKAKFPENTYSSKSREIALRDYLTREFCRACITESGKSRGSGKSGVIHIDRPGQEMLERNSVLIQNGAVEARFVMGLPAFGRRIAGNEAIFMFEKQLPKIVESSLYYKSLSADAILAHVEYAEDADFLRAELGRMGLVAFFANGSVLPRKSGIDPRPLTGKNVIPFQSPKSFEVEAELPNRGKISGMGIPLGITLIVGGGYHGKSTLLNALELGIYNHIPGDGREFVVSDPHAVKIRAEDGRRVEKVNISPFINHLPYGQNTGTFCTENASGSTSQSANIIEALEGEAAVLLIDEDTSATNFMIRDHRMQELVSKEKEPITPFIDKVKQLKEENGVSTVLVIGGSGDYFDVADHVICMVDYIPVDVTWEAAEIAKKYRAERKAEGGEKFGKVISRIPLAESMDPSRGRKRVKIQSRGVDEIGFGKEDIDLGAVEQIIHPSQTRAIGDALNYARRYMDGKRTMREVAAKVLGDISGEGLDVLSGITAGNYAGFRSHEFLAALNRIRSLKVNQK